MNSKKNAVLLICLFFTLGAAAQLPIRNFIQQDEMSITEAWESTGYYYESVPDSYYGEGEQQDSYLTFTVYANEENLWEGNVANFYLLNDSCYQIQYTFYDDPYVIGSIRKVIEGREDFTPCPEMSDCWIQKMPKDTTSYYWNLFDVYEGSEDIKAVIIESGREYQNNKWWYEMSRAGN